MCVCSFIVSFSSMQNWSASHLISKLKDLASRRKLDDLTVGPVLTVSFFLHDSCEILKLIDRFTKITGNEREESQFHVLGRKVWQ